MPDAAKFSSTRPPRTPAAQAAGTDSAAGTPVAGSGDGLVDDELIVEEISIDGMCGVY